MIGGEVAGAVVLAGDNGCGVLVAHHRLKIPKEA